MLPKRGVTRQSSFATLKQTKNICHSNQTIYTL